MRIWLSFLFILGFSGEAFGLQCGEVFVSSDQVFQRIGGRAGNSARERSLTQVYLQRNFQFPLHMNLIQASMAADIVTYGIRPTQQVDLNRAANALNRLHQLFGVSIRIEAPGLKPEVGVRVIGRDVLQGLIDAMLGDNFRTLDKWGYLNETLSARDRLFWAEIKGFFDRRATLQLSFTYREDVTRPNLGAEQLLAIKEYYHDRLMADLIDHLEASLPGGMTSGERAFLSQNQIF